MQVSDMINIYFMRKTSEKALIIVDLQNDFIQGGALEVNDGHEIIPLVNQLLEKKFAVKVATKDWHPPSHGSFASNHPGKRSGERILLAGQEQILWPVHCVQHSKGAEFAPGWDSSKVEHIFYKGVDPDIDSYSTFFDNGHKRSTGLAEYLKERKVTDVYIVGLATDFCVRYSVLDACRLGFNTYVIIDACRGVNLQPQDSNKAIEEMRKAGAHIIYLKEIKCLE